MPHVIMFPMSTCFLLPVLCSCSMFPVPMLPDPGSLVAASRRSSLSSLASHLYSVSCPRFYRRSFEADERPACLVFEHTKSTRLGVAARRDRNRQRKSGPAGGDPCFHAYLPTCLLHTWLLTCLHGCLILLLFVVACWWLLFVCWCACLLARVPVCGWAGLGLAGARHSGAS